MALRLVAQPVGTVNSTLTYCWMFWVLIAAAYAVAVRRRGAGPLRRGAAITPEFAYSAAIPFALLASVIFYLTEGGHLPLVLLTPLALLANFYMVPAAIIWWDHFRQPGSKWRIGSVHVVVLLPALVRGIFSPVSRELGTHSC